MAYQTDHPAPIFMDYTCRDSWHEAAAIFPLLSEDELVALSEDIKAHGLLNPIVLLQEKILDGRNRAIACAKAGIEPTTVEWSGQGASPLAWVISQNIHRRNLTATQKAFIALAAEPIFAKEAKERMLRGKEPCPGTGIGSARKLMAAAFAVGHDYVGQAKQILASAPELVAACVNGNLSIPQAKKKIEVKQARERGDNTEKRKNRDDPTDFETLRDLALKMLNIGYTTLRETESNHSALAAAKDWAVGVLRK